MEVLEIIIGILVSGSAIAYGFVWWCEKPVRDWERTFRPMTEPDPLVELQEVHRLELQDWDFAFQRATGKEAFPVKALRNPFDVSYVPLNHQDKQAALMAALQNESRLDAVKRRQQLDQQQQNIASQLLGGLGRGWPGL